MGLFDKFRKKVQDAASEVDADSLSAEAGTLEAQKAIELHEEIKTSSPTNEEEDWEELDDDEVLELPQNPQTIGMNGMKKKNIPCPPN